MVEMWKFILFWRKHQRFYVTMKKLHLRDDVKYFLYVKSVKNRWMTSSSHWNYFLLCSEHLRRILLWIWVDQVTFLNLIFFFSSLRRFLALFAAPENDTMTQILSLYHKNSLYISRNAWQHEHIVRGSIKTTAIGIRVARYFRKNLPKQERIKFIIRNCFSLTLTTVKVIIKLLFSSLNNMQN